MSVTRARCKVGASVTGMTGGQGLSILHSFPANLQFAKSQCSQEGQGWRGGQLSPFRKTAAERPWTEGCRSGRAGRSVTLLVEVVVVF